MRSATDRPKPGDVRVHVLPRVAVADDQLDWAIRLFLDHKAYVPAITLAGAAEELLAKFLGEMAAMKRIKHVLKEHGTEIDLNLTRNYLKHGTIAGAATDNHEVDDLEAHAVFMIMRAAENLAQTDRSVVSEMPRFWKWLLENRPDLADTEEGGANLA